jgi:hypothetical protein
MSTFQGWFILAMAVGMVAVAIQGIFKGWLPNGPNGFKKGEGVSRESNPVGFWLVFAMYIAFSVAAAAYAIRLLTGHAAP